MSFWNSKKKYYSNRLPTGFSAKDCMKAFCKGWDAVIKHYIEPDTSPLQTNLRTEVELRMAKVLHKLSHEMQPASWKSILLGYCDGGNGGKLAKKAVDAVAHVDHERTFIREYNGSEDFLRSRHLASAAKYAERTGGTPTNIDDLLELAVLHARLTDQNIGWGYKRWGQKIATEKNLRRWVIEAKMAFPELSRVFDILDNSTSSDFKARALYNLLKEHVDPNEQQASGGSGSCCGDGDGDGDVEYLNDFESSLTYLDLEDGAVDRPLRGKWKNQKEEERRAVSKEAYDKAKQFFSKTIELMLETQYANRMVRPEFQGSKLKSRQLAHCFTDGKVFARRDEAPGELLNVAVLLDRSGSIQQSFPGMSGMAKGLLEVVEQYGGESRLWMFGSTTSAMMTSDRLPVNSKWDMEGTTQPFGSLSASTKWLKTRQGRRICVIITDGMWDDQNICYHHILKARAHNIEYLLVTFHDGNVTRNFREAMLHAMPASVMVASGKTVPEVAGAAMRALRVR